MLWPDDPGGQLRPRPVLAQDQESPRSWSAKTSRLSVLPAGILRKLMFGASQPWGKIGRAILIGPCPITAGAGLAWRTLVMHRPPRPIPRSGPKKSDVVIFTDGSTSSPKDPSTELIGEAPSTVPVWSLPLIMQHCSGGSPEEIWCFPPVIGADVRVLICGRLPRCGRTKICHKKVCVRSLAVL